MDAPEPEPPSPFELRRAVAADAQAIGAVFDAAVRANWTFLGDVAKRPMFSAQDWDRMVADHAPPNALLVATDAGHRVIGYAAVHAEDGEMFLLFVDPAQAGRGVGRALLDAAHEVLRDAGRTEAFLFTEERNTRARAVYAAAGYRPDGTVRESELEGVPLSGAPPGQGAVKRFVRARQCFVKSRSGSGRPVPSLRSRSPSVARCDTRSTAAVLATVH